MEPIFADEELTLGASPSSLLAQTQRWYRKANALVEAWRIEQGRTPPTSAVILALSVAQLETRCGDVWPGANNWGAVQARVPTKTEAKLLEAVPPKPANIQAGQQVLADAVARGEIEAFPGGTLQVDSSPGKGYYWVFFQAFPDEAQGARRFVRVLVSNRSGCRTVLESPAASEQELAAAMYASRYYEGSYNPALPGGKEKNIGQYASAIRSWTPSIRKALQDWIPGKTPPASLPPPAPSPEPDEGSPVWLQWALNRLGIVPPLIEDGIIGPKTKVSVAAFQQAQGLKVDGWAGPVTRAKLKEVLKREL